MHTFIKKHRLKPTYMTYTKCYLCNINITNQDIFMINNKPTCSKKCRSLFYNANINKLTLCDLCFKRIDEEVKYNNSQFCSRLCCESFKKKQSLNISQLYIA